MTLRGFRAPILSVPRDPRLHAEGAVRFEADGLLVVEDGMVIARGPFAELAPRFTGLAVENFPGRLILPGFIDAHVHYPQVDSIAAHGEQLLKWLETHIFPVEKRFANKDHARAVADFFCDELLRNGTTSALVFATVHPQSVDAIFEAALARKMRLIAGKVLMDLGPEGLADTPESARAESEELIARWHGKDRLGYAVTPRFALTSSTEQLQVAAELLAKHPDVLLHTHLSENQHEIAEASRLYPEARDYTDIYARFGLVGPRSVFAHGIHLSHDECQGLAEAGSSIAFCPTSNMFLGSGLFDLSRVSGAGVNIALGSDVGAGTSLSLLATQGAAYKTCQLQGNNLDPFVALHLATAAGAAALGVSDKVGALEEGQEADFLVIDPAATELLARRTAGAAIGDLLFALQILGDDRVIERSYVLGDIAHSKSAAS